MSEQSIEAKIVAAGKTAPRIGPEDVDGCIASDAYHVFPGTTVTVCCLTLDNGFTTIGQSACADPSNFDESIGRQIAYRNAREQIWHLLGFRLRDFLNASATSKAQGV